MEYETLDEIISTPSDVRMLRARVVRLEQYERIVRRLWFFFAGLIPRAWRDETIQRWMKDEEK